MDFFITGGLLHTTSHSLTSELEFLLFEPIPSIDWTKAFTPVCQQGTQDINNDSLNRLRIAYPVIERVKKVHLARVFRDYLSEAETTMPDILPTLNSRVDDLRYLIPDLTSERIHEALSELHEGYRWLDLIELIGFEEILLLQREHLGLFASGTPSERFDVEQIVTDGTEDDFNRLKHLLTTSFSWIHDTCVRLDGFFDLFLRSLTLLSLGNIEGAQNLGYQLQEKVTGCFGNTAKITSTRNQLFMRFEEYLANSVAEIKAELPSDDEIRAFAMVSDFHPHGADESQDGTADLAHSEVKITILLLLLGLHLRGSDYIEEMLSLLPN
ncbi:hypothetical protein N7462_010278 [Penicillium macrosclerotiorum]|uniref:uncharacterized protein n=1 Tax=Penicillium macrosclerotiorum TaxID=303699 RepID=UPI00254883CE|nr:uncharacterized protein N7462_010278 [Penicillium macrosclerotiorum]KAJ5669208.1 hypothetical protein N7462_010278 [Penicillium macrosclerotiorum]